MTTEDDNQFVRRILWDTFPEIRAKISEMESDEVDAFGWTSEENELATLGIYTLASEIFVEQILKPSVESEEYRALFARRASHTLEQLLAADRPGVKEMVSIRITDYLLGYVQPWLTFKDFAGPLMLKEVAERKQYYSGPF